MKKLQIIGLLLWRGGLLCAIGYGFFRVANFALNMLRMWGIRIPFLLKTGCAFVIAGFLLLLLSLILERLRDAAKEKEEHL